MTRSAYFRLEIPLRTTIHFSLFYSLFPCPAFPLLFILLSYLYLPITFSFFLCFLMSIPIILGIFLPPLSLPPHLSVSLAFFSVSLLSLSTFSLLTIHSFPHLDQSLCRNQMDILKRSCIFKVEFMLLLDLRAAQIFYDFKGNYELVVFQEPKEWRSQYQSQDNFFMKLLDL